MKTNLIKSFLLLFPLIGIVFPDFIKAEELKIELKDGTKIIGTLINEISDSLNIVIDNPNLGFIEIPVDSLVENETNKTVISQFKETEDLVEPIPVEQLFDEKPSTTFYSRWQNSIQGGFNSSSSKSRETIGYSLSTNTQYRGIFNEYSLSTSYAYNESSTSFSSAVGNNSGNIDFEKDRTLNKKLFIYNTIHYRFNDLEFAGKHRIQKSIGLGYYLFKKDRFSLKTLVGPAAIFHNGGESCSDSEYCGELIPGWDIENLLKWNINKRFDINISDVYSLASMHNLTGSNYLRTTLNFRPYLDKNLTMSLFFENSHYEFTSSEPRNNIRFQVGKIF